MVLHFNLCSFSWWQECSSSRKRGWFLPGLRCSCSTLFPKTNSQGFEALILLFQESEHRHLFSPLLHCIPPWLLLPSCYWRLCSCLLHTLISRGLAVMMWLRRNAVASQHRRVTYHSQGGGGRKEKSPNNSFWVTMVCVRNPSIQSLHWTRADFHQKMLPEGLVTLKEIH